MDAARLGPQEEKLHLPARGAAAEDAGGRHPRVVDHEEVARLQELGQIAHLRVAEAGSRHQQARAVARGDRFQSDAIGGKFVAEVGDPHLRPFAAALCY